MSVATHAPYALATVGGDPVHLVDAEVAVSRYTRADSGMLSVPREQALDTPAYTPVRLEMGYRHGGPFGTFSLYTTGAPATAGRLSLADEYHRLGDESHRVARTFHDATLDRVIRDLLADAGVATARVRAFETPKAAWHLYRKTVREAIEAASRDWGVRALSYFDAAGAFYFGEDRDPSETITRFAYGESVTGKPERFERRVRLDYVEISMKEQLRREGKSTRDVAGRTVEERWEEEHGELAIDTSRLPVIYAPWIWHGDVVDVDHPEMPTGPYVVASARHALRGGTTLELEALQ